MQSLGPSRIRVRLARPDLLDDPGRSRCGPAGWMGRGREVRQSGAQRGFVAEFLPSGATSPASLLCRQLRVDDGYDRSHLSECASTALPQLPTGRTVVRRRGYRGGCGDCRLHVVRVCGTFGLTGMQKLSVGMSAAPVDSHVTHLSWTRIRKSDARAE